MFTRIGWIAALSLLVGIGLGSQAQAKTFEHRWAGGLQETARDFVDEGDGFFGLTGLALAKGGPGSAQISLFVEPGPPVANTDCPVGFIQQPVLAANFVTTFKNLSLLSGGRGRGVGCLDLATGNLSVVVEGVITGGNGRFEGATGSWQVTAEAEPARGGSFRVTGTTVYDLD
jgi:hypothetical protein